MLKNYLKIALRNLRRNKGYAFINIIGLAIGLAVCLLIGLYVRHELSYDRFHEKSDRIVRIGTNLQSPDGSSTKAASVGWPVGRILAAEYPEVKQVTYMRTFPSFSIERGGRRFFEGMLYADSSFFNVFSFSLTAGNPESALTRPYSLVLTEETARKYFGDDHALGQTLTLGDTLQFTVTGVAEVPRTSHIQFDMLVSFETLCTLYGRCASQFESGWGNLNVYNYALLQEGTSRASFQKKIEDLVMQRSDQVRKMGYNVTLDVQPLENIYLRSNRQNDRVGPSGSITYVYLLAAVGLFVLVIACVNFMNLSTARSMERAQEVAVRKAFGSSRGALVRQFLGESVLVTGTAFCIAVLLARLALPLFNSLAGKTIPFASLVTPASVIMACVLALGVSFLAGSYPAFVLSGFRPAQVLRGSFSTSRRGPRLRKGLVIFQFILSCVLIVSTLVVLRQLSYMQEKDPGFNKEQVVVMDARQADSQVRAQKYETIKRQLTEHPAVQRVTATGATPGQSGWPAQMVFPEGHARDEGFQVEYLAVDRDYVETLELGVLAGRDFAEAVTSDEENALLVNETMAQQAGWETPENAVGKKITSPSGYPEGTVVGVIKDYHHHGLQNAIGPMIMDVNPGAFRVFALRIEPGRTADILAHMKNTWRQFFPEYAFDYFSLDESFARQYHNERRLAGIFGLFSTLAILIACLGLFGLAAYTAERRTKEIGIRKVLGASVPSIVMLLSKDFLKLVGIALLIAAPAAYYAMSRWLQDFAYHIELSPWIFLGAGLLALMIALATVSYHALRAALSNPVDAIRYE